MQAMLVLYLVTATGFASAPTTVAQYSDMDTCKVAAERAQVIQKTTGSAGARAGAVFVCAPMSDINLPRR
jgi:hypothetical protein